MPSHPGGHPIEGVIHKRSIGGDWCGPPTIGVTTHESPHSQWAFLRSKPVTCGLHPTSLVSRDPWWAPPRVVGASPPQFHHRTWCESSPRCHGKIPWPGPIAYLRHFAQGCNRAHFGMSPVARWDIQSSLPSRKLQYSESAKHSSSIQVKTQQFT